MKFVVSSTALLNVLQTSNKVVSNKNTLPILDNFLFELKDGVLKITASDLETTMIGTLKVDSMEQEGVIAAPVKLMIDSLKEFSEQPLTIEANESTWEIQISWKTGKLAIPGTSGLSYPTQPALDEEAGDIIRAIKFHTEKELIAFINNIQQNSPVDSYVEVLPWDMPGYEDQVIMAAGCFVQGASIELSADAPIKEPYIAYMQGGLTYEHVKIALKNLTF